MKLRSLFSVIRQMLFLWLRCLSALCVSSSRKALPVLILCCALLPVGCSNEPAHESSVSYSAVSSEQDITTESREVFAMDTVMTIRATGVNAADAVDAAVKEIQRLDALLSVGDSGSEVYAVNKNGKGELSEDTLYLTQKALQIYESTSGAYDMTVYPLMQLWGFTGEHPSVPEEKDIKRVLEHCGSDKLTLSGNTLILGNGQGIDFGGIAKGYASGRIMKIFEDKGMISGVVSLGGNVHCYRTKPDGSMWRCGITDPEHPDDTSFMLGVLSVSDKAVITSGGYERFFSDSSGGIYHHIMDMKTGHPADSGLVSVTIVSSDGAMADGLSTACYVMGEEKAIDYWRQNKNDFDMILLTSDDRLLVTEGITDSFSSEKPVHKISAS